MEDYTQPIVIAAKLYAIAICPVLFVLSLTKLITIIRNTANYVINLTYHMLRIVPSLVHITDSVHYYM